jgi:hypothetical protein
MSGSIIPDLKASFLSIPRIPSAEESSIPSLNLNPVNGTANGMNPCWNPGRKFFGN